MKLVSPLFVVSKPCLMGAPEGGVVMGRVGVVEGMHRETASGLLGEGTDGGWDAVLAVCYTLIC